MKMQQYTSDTWSGQANLTPNPEGIIINVDLIGLTPIYLKYLESWRQYIKEGNNDQFIRLSIRRYERFWLNLLNQLTSGGNGANGCHDNMGYEPPPDVHWIWHLHMLDSENYSTYCLQRFGKIFSHRFCRNDSDQITFKSRAAHSWLKAFPNEPFYLEYNQLQLHTNQLNNKNNQNGVKNVPPTSWPITATRLDHLLISARKDKEFLYRVDLPQFRDQTFQFAANMRYRNFLALKQICSSWEPDYLPADVELMWRVHIMQPIQYLEDIKRIFNSINKKNNFAHIINGVISKTNYNLEYKFLCNGKSLNVNMHSSILAANQLWSQYYPNDENTFFSDGTIPRLAAFVVDSNINHNDKSLFCLNFANNKKCLTSYGLKLFPKDEYENIFVENCDLTFTNVCVEDLWNKQKKFKVKTSKLGANSFQREIIFEAKGYIGHIVCKPDKQTKLIKHEAVCLGQCKFDPKENQGLEIQVFAGQGFGCFMKYRPVADKIFNPLQNLSFCKYVSDPNLNNSSRSKDVIQIKHQLILPKVTYTDPKITLNYVVEVANRRPFQFCLDRNPGEITDLPAYLDIYLSNVLLWQYAKTDVEDGKDFLVARHSLKCKEACLAFGVEVIKNDAYNLCAVMLFHNNQNLVALAYTVDSGYLANSTQVLQTCPLTYDPLMGDRAMLVQKFSGDDLVIIARGVDGANGGDNKIVFKTYSTQKKFTQTIEIREDELQTFSNDFVTVDLPTGKLTVTSNAENLPENIVWAFCVGCLYISALKFQTNNKSMSSSHSMMGISSSSLLKLNGGGSVKSTSGHLVMAMDGSGSDNFSTGKKSRKKLSLKQQRQNSKQSRRRKMSASFTFLLACGFQTDLCSNSHQRSRSGFQLFNADSFKKSDGTNIHNDMNLLDCVNRFSLKFDNVKLNEMTDAAENLIHVESLGYINKKNDISSKLPIRNCYSYNNSSNNNIKCLTCYDEETNDKL